MISSTGSIASTGSPARRELPDTARFTRDPFTARTGELLVGLEAAAAEGVGKMLEGAGAGRVEEELLRSGRVSLKRIRLDSGLSPREAASLLDVLPQVLYAEPDHAVRMDYSPADPAYQPEQWGLHNYGQLIGGTEGLPGADIGAEEAWDIERGLSNPVTVAVVDTGLDLYHPDLEDKIWVNAGEVPGNGVDDDANGYVDDTRGYNWAGITQGRYYYYDYAEKRYYTTAWYFGYSLTNRLLAQSIRGTGCPLTHVGIILQRVGNPAEGVTVSLRSSLSGADLSSLYIAPGEVSESGGEIYLPLSVPVNLAEGATYYLVFRTSNLDTSNHYYLYHNFVDDPPDPDTDQYDPYLDGREYRWTGSAWEEFGSWDFYFRTNPNPRPRDDNGHGTHVAGIIGAEEGNAEGGVGVSFGAGIIPLKVLDCSGSGYYSDIISGMRYAADGGAEVINLSLGGTSYSDAMQEAVDYARAKGAVVLAAAGNSGDGTVLYPAGCEGVVGVGATTNRDVRAAFSSYNQYVDLTAPGWFVYSTMPTYPAALNSLGYGQGYDYLSGTSMATPMASGLAALVRSLRPGYGPDEVWVAMRDHARDLGPPGRDDEYGYGRIDAAATLESIQVAPYISSLAPSRGRVGEKVTIEGSAFGSVRGASSVSFGGVEASLYDAWSDTAVTCYVPPGVAGVVEVTLTTPGGISNARAFSVLPTISSLAPSRGRVGEKVTIEGSAFGSVRGASSVSFGGVEASLY
ncbi:MAG: S8 family serine peptidase, partial [Actinomycetota bacterium]|nr:S8 family serine peptidase [Actinomycetota bacterium]